MKLKDIKEVGFYKEVDGDDLWECIENEDPDEEYRQKEPLFLDSWLYQYTDFNDRKVYESDGLLYRIGYDYPDLEVEKTNEEYEISGSMGHILTEKKSTYKEKYENLLKEFEDWKQVNRATGICETCTDKALQENDNIRIKLKNIKSYIGSLDEKVYDPVVKRIKEILGDNK